MDSRPPQINTSSPPAQRGKSRTRNQFYVVCGVLAVLATVLAWVARGLFTEPTEPSVLAKPQALGSSDNAPPTEPELATSVLVDNGRTLWASPTAGGPLDLRYLPPGCSLILALRPAELLAHAEGEKTLAALGPSGAASVAQLEAILGTKLSEVEQLLIGVRAPENQLLDVCLVARFREPQQLGSSAEWAVFAPPKDSGRTLVFARTETLREIEEQGDGAPLLRRELELLASTTDSERHLTLICAPNFLFADGESILSGVAGPLREPLFNQLRDELRGVAVSAQWGNDFFIELRAIATSDVTPTQLSAQLAEQVARWPQQVEDTVLGLTVDPHGRRVVARLPAMTRALANYTRAGVEEDRAELRAVLPLAAGHNLLMATELLLAQQGAGPVASGEVVATTDAKPQSVADRLQKQVTLRFERETLETALRLLSEDIGVEILLVGGDLQLEGITKNQSFGIDLADQPAETILLEIVRLANPDNTATSLADAKQKMVYVVKPKETGGENVIFVTTRAQAAQRGDELPAAFRGGAP